MTRLLRIEIEGRDDSVLFLGHPLELLRDVVLTDYARKRQRGRSTFAAWLWPPNVEQLLGYFVSLSAALGVLNIVPAFGFDGQHAVTAAFELTDLSMTQKAVTVTAICFVCTGLLVANIAVVLIGLL
jgi:S2P endopeptidase